MTIQRALACFIVFLGIIASGCKELIPSNDDSEIVVIGNGMDLTGPRLSGTVVANVREDENITSYVVRDGDVEPVLTDANSGEEVSAEVTDVSGAADGSELIRVKARGGACEVFERDIEGRTSCREDLDSLPVADDQLPSILIESEAPQKIVYLRDDQSLVMKAESEGKPAEFVLATNVQEYRLFQNTHVLFRKVDQSEWFYRSLEQEESVEPTALAMKIVFEGVDEEIFGFTWQTRVNSEETDYGLARVNLLDHEVQWVWRGSSRRKFGERLSPVQQFVDGSVLLHLKDFSAGGKEGSSYFYISPFLDDLERLPLELPVEGVQLMVGRHKVLVTYKEANAAQVTQAVEGSEQLSGQKERRMSTCLFEEQFYREWLCQPFDIDLDQYVVDVALNANDELVMAVSSKPRTSEEPVTDNIEEPKSKEEVEEARPKTGGEAQVDVFGRPAKPLRLTRGLVLVEDAAEEEVRKDPEENPKENPEEASEENSGEASDTTSDRVSHENANQSVDTSNKGDRKEDTSHQPEEASGEGSPTPEKVKEATRDAVWTFDLSDLSIRGIEEVEGQIEKLKIFRERASNLRSEGEESVEDADFSDAFSREPLELIPETEGATQGGEENF